MRRKTFYSVLIMHFILQAHLSFGQSGFCELADWAALKALYESTNGDNWKINTGWEIVKTDEPPEDCDLGSLYGVKFGGDCFVDDEGVVDCFYPLGIFDIFLDGNNLNGTIPPEIGNLGFLKTLGLSNNNLTGSLPKEIAKLSNLEYLGINDNQLNGCYNEVLKQFCTQLPGGENFQDISEGNNFDASWNNFCETGAGTCVPQQPSNCRQADSLALIEIYKSLNADDLVDFSKPINDWFGVTLNEKGCVATLSLGNSNLSGEIPAEIGDLSEVTFIDLLGNNITGSIPAEIGNLSKLNYLDVGFNQIEYAPESIGKLSNLETLYLDNNKLTQLPPTFSNLDKLIVLFVNDNQLTGQLPTWLTELELLSELQIQNNQLSGCYAIELTQLCNQFFFFGDFTISDGNNFDAKWEDFCETGAGSCTSPPANCRQTDSLALIAIYQSLKPNHTWNLSTPIDNWPGVRIINENGCVDKLDLSERGLSGVIPPEIGNLSEITFLRMVENEITGFLSAAIGNLTTLKVLSLADNNMSGPIPGSLKNLTNLEALYLSQNQFTEAPLEIGNFDKLTELFLSVNQLSGCYPSEFIQLCDQLIPNSNSNFAISDGNNFEATWEDFCATGNGACKSQAPGCRKTDSLALIAIYQSLNAIDLVDFSNPIDSWIGVILNENGCVDGLELSNSNLSGKIPSEIGDLSEVTFISLLHNNITGSIPAEISKLSKLNSLDVGFNQIENLPESIGELSNLESLFLDGNKLTQLPSTLSNLNNLTILLLNDNQIIGQLPIWLTELEQLFDFQIQFNQLIGCYANELSQFCNQFSLFNNFTISDGNNFEATWEDFCATEKGACTPEPLGCRQTDSLALIAIYQSLNATDLVDFSKPVDDWFGITLNKNGCVDELDLSNLNLSGEIPAEIGDLSEVTFITLIGNNIVGSVPAEIGNLSKLNYLDIGLNQIESLPETIGKLSNLTTLFLDENKLTQLPVSLGNLDKLDLLIVNDNQLTGKLPIWLVELEQLSDFQIQNNQLSGCYANELSQLCNQSYFFNNFFISEGNNFEATWEDFCATGNGVCTPEPPSCRQTDSLALIAIYQSLNATDLVDFSKPINDWFGVILNENGCVDGLQLASSNLSGEIPAEIGDLSEVTVISLFDNNIKGLLPAEIGNLSKLIDLDIGSNQIEFIPETIGKLSNLEFLLLDDNKLTQLPSTFSNLDKLTVLLLNENQLKGQLPIWLTELEQLFDFQIQDNQLSGCYADELNQLCNQFNFFNNFIISDGNNFEATWEDFCNTGKGICSIQNCNIDDWTALKALYESTNGDNWINRTGWDVMIDGQNSPPANCNLSELEGIFLDEEERVSYAYLWYNNLQGEIPSEISLLKNLEGLWLSGPNNQLTGSIPREIGMLSNLKYFIADNNQLSDVIPTEIGKLNKLVSLVLSNNKLNGKIPYQISFLSNLEDLFLDGNQLSDEIPPELSKLDKLYNLVLVNNQLSGCYADELKQLCDQISPDFNLFIPGAPVDAIAYGNNFETSWKDFCAGIACNDNKIKVNEAIESYNYPNPFSTYTNINYTLTEQSEITLTIYDANGTQVAQLSNNEKQKAGEHSAIFESSHYPSGVYYYQIKSKRLNKMKKMVLAK